MFCEMILQNICICLHKMSQYLRPGPCHATLSTKKTTQRWETVFPYLCHEFYGSPEGQSKMKVCFMFSGFCSVTAEQKFQYQFYSTKNSLRCTRSEMYEHSYTSFFQTIKGMQQNMKSLFFLWRDSALNKYKQILAISFL